MKLIMFIITYLLCLTIIDFPSRRYAPNNYGVVVSIVKAMLLYKKKLNTGLFIHNAIFSLAHTLLILIKFKM